MKFGTKVIHAGVKPDPTSGAVMTPIYQTTTYVQAAPGVHKGYQYARGDNPTRNALQDNLAALENGTKAICFSSGLAAMDAVIRMLKPGDEVLSTNDLYGGSYRQLERVHSRYAIKTNYVDMSTPSSIKQHINEHTKLIWVETPTNPMLNIIDIETICKIAQEKSIPVCVDNTFASPFLQNPLDLGADLVLHSCTKYLGGHSDVVMGAVICKTEEMAEHFKFIQNAVGAVPGPQDCFLMLRGIKTLHLRVQRACENALAIAHYLKEHPKVNRVNFPGFEDHPNHQIAKKQMRMFGAMVSFDLKGDDFGAATRILSNTHYFYLAESLGGVESLIGHPASMTHASIPKEERLKIGLTDSLIRLSVGVEDVNDLIEDLKAALDKV